MTWFRRLARVLCIPAACSLACAATTARGQDPAVESPIARIDAEYARGLREVEEKRIKQLDDLAKTQKGDEAAVTLEALFRDALAAQLFEAAEPAAERILAAPGDSPVVDYLAAAVNVLAEADRGEFEQSYKSILDAQSKGEKVAGGVEARELALPAGARITLIETYYQRLAQADQFPILRKALAAIGERAAKTGEDDVAAFVADRIFQIDLIGQPAPEIAGVNQDNKPVTLSKDFRGQVVLVVFWATWCLPSADQVAWLADLHDRYSDKGFQVLGVNLDLHQEGAPSPESFEPLLRQYLLQHNVHWPSIIDKPGDGNVAAAYGVTEIPSTALIGADGKIAQLDVTVANAEPELVRALQAAGKLPATR